MKSRSSRCASVSRSEISSVVDLLTTSSETLIDGFLETTSSISAAIPVAMDTACDAAWGVQQQVVQFLDPPFQPCDLGARSHSTLAGVVTESIHESLTEHLRVQTFAQTGQDGVLQSHAVDGGIDIVTTATLVHGAAGDLQPRLASLV